MAPKLKVDRQKQGRFFNSSLPSRIISKLENLLEEPHSFSEVHVRSALNAPPHDS
jgi:hypothetical protein